MMTELISLGMNGARLNVKADGIQFTGDNLQKVCDLIGQMEHPLELLERRGIDIRYLLKYNAGDKSRLPRYRVLWGDSEKWFLERDEADAFLKSLLPPAPVESAESSEAPATPVVPVMQVEKTAQLVDLHEIKTLNDVFAQLKDYGFFVADFTPAGVRNAEPVYPFVLERDDDSVKLTSLRDLLNELRRLGEKGLTLTRFKGLGEMNSEELWDTSMDPEKRTLLQVRMEDAAAADEIFRVLMGDAVEPRREFIEKHALDVKELDI
jgi:DNA gyrase subunit B